MILTIEISGGPVSKNEGLRVDPRRPNMPMFRPQEATDWMRRIRREAQRVARAAGWPEPFAVKSCSITFHKYNVRHDSGAGNEYVFDALQIPTVRDMKRFQSSWGLYANDKVAWTKTSPPPIIDGGGRRCVFTVELLETHEPAEAERLRLLWLASIRRAQARARMPRG